MLAHFFVKFGPSDFAGEVDGDASLGFFDIASRGSAIGGRCVESTGGLKAPFFDIC